MLMLITIALLNPEKSYGKASEIVFSHLSTTTFSNPMGLAVDNGYMYVADASDNFLIYDVSDPSNPQYEDYISITNATDVFLSGSNAYVTSFTDLTWINIYEPTFPFYEDAFNDFQMQNMVEIFIVGDKFVIRDEVTGVFSFDIYPFGFDGPDNLVSEANAIWGSRNNIYIAGNETLEQRSIDDMYLRIADVTNMNLFDITVQEPYVYTAAGPHGLMVYDTNTFDYLANFSNGENFTDVSILGSHAFVATNESGICVLDITDVHSIAEIDVKFQTTGLSNLKKIYVYPGYIYAINNAGEILIQSWELIETTITDTITETDTVNTVTVNVSLTETTTNTVTEYSNTTTNTQIITATETEIETLYNQTSTSTTTQVSSELIYTTIPELITTTRTNTETSSFTKTQNITYGSETVSVYLTSEVPLIVEEQNDPSVIQISMVPIISSFIFIVIAFHKKRK
jgi:hypothetical protein